MRLVRIEVENYGVFYGKHVFDLRPTDLISLEKPIILFMGNNGTGKTTLFDAFRLCLYGSNFQGSKLSKLNYNRYLRQRLHRSPKGTLNTASVSVDFDYAQAGRSDNYLVKRSWTCRDTKTIESLQVYRNGELLKELDEEQWQDFVFELIPLGVSKLFFFDGEQIQDLAENESDSSYLTSSLNALLGLDLVDRLQADLRIYLLRKVKEEDKRLGSELSDLQGRQKRLEEQLDTVLQRRAHVQSEMDSVLSQIEHQEHQIAKEGGWFAGKREELRVAHKKLDEEIEVTKDQIRNLCSGLLPFTIVSNLCTSLRDRLIEEEKYEQKKAAVAVLDSVLEVTTKEIRDADFWKGLQIPIQCKEEIVSKVAETLKRNSEFIDKNPVQIVHSLSSAERNKLLSWIDQAVRYVPTELSKFTSRLEKLVRERQGVDDSLFRAPLDDVLNPLIEKLATLGQELGVLQETYRNVEEEAHTVQFELNQVIRQIEHMLDKKIQLQKLSQRTILAKKVQSVLHEYAVRLRKGKTRSLCDAFLECFRLLSNKEYLIEKVDMEPNSFSITLYGHNGEIMQKSQLSAGEKQIFAVAMLWALARASGRRLPFMIDTPLGRLDSEHRENLVQNFFPHASHQIIIFSTDTEIDRQCFHELEPYISKAYHLDYDEGAEMTIASERYLGEGEEGKVITNELHQN